ncbi:protealysin inhibitor emfourin [Candidatus Nitrosotenuis cloacae]|uniref:protealysin inhibitor emfourin n=1 Tax=Candidatus Nitrosotenuis cloacae TaxID=1603555 RepID=UPI0022822078|nr:protealysin inhibitor emfourin [Candidatus Nitrosotenuis cloacae]
MKATCALLVLVASMIMLPANHAIASQNGITFYGKGTADQSSPFAGKFIRTLIDGDTATIIHIGRGIEIVRMNLMPSDACIQTESTMCFDGIVTSVKNNEMHQIGDKIGVTLDLTNNRETITVNSGSMQGTTVAITLSKAHVKLNGPYVITLTQEGGIAGISKTITLDTSTGIVSENNIPIDDHSIKSINAAIKKAKFFDLQDQYPSVEGAADYFTYSIQISQGGFQKKVVWTDTSEDVPEKLLELHNTITHMVQVKEPIATEAETAQDFVRMSPTFAFDGIDDSLQVESHHILESFPEQHVITMSFDSLHGGYGDRSDQMVTQAITSHTIVVRIVEGEVISAVIDEIWDEITQEEITPES